MSDSPRYRYRNSIGLCRLDDDGQYRTVDLHVISDEGEAFERFLAAVPGEADEIVDLLVGIKTGDPSLLGEALALLVDDQDPPYARAVRFLGRYRCLAETPPEESPEESPEEAPAVEAEGEAEAEVDPCVVTLEYDGRKVPLTPERLKQATKLAKKLQRIASNEGGRQYLRDMAEENPQFEGVVKAVLGEEEEEEIEEVAERHPVQMVGSSLHAIIKGFCRRPEKGQQGGDPLCSIGVGENSIIATDSHRLIVCGLADSTYQSTALPRTKTEADKSTNYRIPCDWSALPPVGHDSSIDHPVLPGMDDACETVGYPNLLPLMGQVQSARKIGEFRAEHLLQIARAATALGAATVTLLDGVGLGEDLMAFRFEAPGLEDGDGNLVGLPYPVCGLVTATKRAKGDTLEEREPSGGLEGLARD